MVGEILQLRGLMIQQEHSFLFTVRMELFIG